MGFQSSVPGAKNPPPPRTSSPSKPAPAKSSDSGWGFLGSVAHAVVEGAKSVGRFFADVPKVVAPIVHDIGAVGKGIGYALAELAPGGAKFSPSHLWEYPAIEAMRPGGVSVPLGLEAEKRIKNLPYTLKELSKGSTYSHPSRLLKVIADSPVGLVLPGINSASQLTSKEGRKQMWEHPLFTFLDVLPIASKVGGPLGKVGAALGDLTETTKLGQKAASLSAPLRASFSLRQAKIGSSVFTVARESKGIIQDSLREIATKRKALSHDSWVELNDRLTNFDPPPLGHPLKELFDEVKTHQELQGQGRLVNALPEEYKLLLKTKALKYKAPNAGTTYEESLTKGLEQLPGWGPEKAQAAMAHVTQAIMDDAPNPLAGLSPEIDKIWNKVTARVRGNIAREERTVRNYQEPVTGAQYGRPDWIAFKKKVYGSGRVADVTIEELGQRAAAELVDGALTPESAAYIEAVKELPPGSYQRYIRPMKVEARSLRQASEVAVGTEKQAFVEAADAMEASIREAVGDLISRGERPVYIPSPPKSGPHETVRISRLRSRTPGSNKGAQGLAPAYEDDAFVAMFRDEAEHALRNTTLKTMPEVWNQSGARTWSDEMAKLREVGIDEAKASAMVKREFNGFDVSTSGKVSIGEARPGSLLLPKGVAKVVDHAFNPPPMGLSQKFMRLWMIPTLTLAPMFHANNIFGGGLLTALKLKMTNPIGMMKDFGEAFAKARKGEILDPRIPTGTGFAPMFSEILTPTVEAMSASWMGEGLAAAFRKALRAPIKQTIAFSERMNHFFDEFYRNVTYLNTARATGDVEKGLLAAQRLLQDADSMLPFEREVMQRLIPFWTWKRTVLRWVMTYPVDHPVRMTILNQMAKQHEEQRDVSEQLDHFLMDYLPIGEKDAEGYRKYVSLRSLNPFNDAGNLGSLKGWLNSLNPIAQMFMESTTGYDSFLGGVPAYASKENTTIDPESGAHIRKPTIENLWDLIPQLKIVKSALGLDDPVTDDYDGWVRWWKKWGPALRLLPALRIANLDEDKTKYDEINQERGTGGPNKPASLDKEAKVYTTPYKGPKGGKVITKTTPYQNPNRNDVSA